MVRVVMLVAMAAVAAVTVREGRLGPRDRGGVLQRCGAFELVENGVLVGEEVAEEADVVLFFEE